MRLQTSYRSSSSLFLLSILASASASPSPHITTTPSTTIDQSSQQQQQQQQNTPTASPALDPSSWVPISTIFSYDPPNPDLRHREVIDNPAAPQPAPIPTQVSPVTTLMLWEKGQQVPVVYSQAFSEVPDQWPGPSSGQIGLGTIKGTVGVVKSNDKVKREHPSSAAVGVGGALQSRRDAQPQPFLILPPGQGDESVYRPGLEKRKSNKGSSGSTGAAVRMALDAGPPTLALLIAVVAAMVL